jgi:hypothetical protein
MVDQVWQGRYSYGPAEEVMRLDAIRDGFATLKGAAS